jgi:hypothetical protein
MIRSRATVPDARGSRSGAVGSSRARRRGDFCLVSSAVKNCEPGTADFRRQRKACYTSRILRQEFASLRSRLPTLWSRSYYAGTIGRFNRKALAGFLELQGKL